MDDRLSGITPFLPPAIQKQLEALSAGQRRQVTELRLRAGQPLALTLAGETVFLAPWASKSPAGAAAVTNEQLQQTLLLCCGHSLHSCADSLRQGFVTLPGGHRVGVAGTARTEAGQVLSVHSITSLNIRVAGVVPDAGDILLQRFYAAGLAGALIAGPPLSGKTTVLKSIIRKLSGGWQGKYRRVAVVDERGELAGCGGITADILASYPKAEGIELALRSLSPELICCDELSAGETGALLSVMNAGVPLLCTVHAGDKAELRRKRWLQPFFAEKVFRYTAFLTPDKPGELVEIINGENFGKGA